MKEKITAFLEKERTSVEKAAIILGSVTIGLVIGFSISPVKGGVDLDVQIGSHNGCNNSYDSVTHYPFVSKKKKQK